jgi:predicted ATPase
MEITHIPFTVISRKSTPSSIPLRAYLRTDNWNDFGFYTLYILLVADQMGQLHEIGGVKIGQFGMNLEEKRSPDVPSTFPSLDETFFSLGQDDSYYDNLNKLGEDIKNKVLVSLRDIVIDSVLYDKAVKEKVTIDSLLRFVSETTVHVKFRRIVQGGERLTPYKFEYQLPPATSDTDNLCVLSFDVEHDINPPSNIHVLIGRNGVGKTRIIKLMTRSLIHNEVNCHEYGRFSSREILPNDQLFVNLVSVTFSAFDPFDLIDEKHIKEAKINYYYVGLKRIEATSDGQTVTVTKADDELTSEFVTCLGYCCSDQRAKRWRNALSVLESDLIFKEAGVASLHDVRDTRDFKSRAAKIFKNLSSGHKIVLLTITRLIETVAERTLVLLDEPEAHLHPPLLSAFIRALSDLLIDRNGVAIIATHSPVVLQEVPRCCVWKICRVGRNTKAERPESETFGENVGVLTREVFGLEVINSGFHKLIREAVHQGGSYGSIVHDFNGKLGAEARAIIQALIAARVAEPEV